jgi:hypothetical protein
MSALAPEYRWLATSMVSAEIPDIYRAVYADQRWFEQTYGGLSDLADNMTVTRVAQR